MYEGSKGVTHRIRSMFTVCFPPQNNNNNNNNNLITQTADPIMKYYEPFRL